ncbi:MAG: ADP-ribosylglycohydrolase family protein [Anaerolineae bacterium]|nr:ADP-ribosylglycohydrolase family protein [Anaerolineae bacterium]
MLPSISLLRQHLTTVIADKEAQGHRTEGLAERLAGLPDSYDALWALALELRDLPLRPDWPYREPNDLDEIWAECDPRRPTGALADVDLQDSAERVETAFLASACGCILGKPLEVDPALDEIRAAAQVVGAWPLDDYVSEALLEALGRRHRSWSETVRERIRYVASDDDINYTVLGMLLLEERGLGLQPADVMQMWLRQLPPGWTFGPERVTLAKAALHSTLYRQGPDAETLANWVNTLNPGDEKCGALIRADAYGYACPGRPALAAELAWRDASCTHRRTGIYGAMFIAAAIATAQVATDPLDVFETALQFVPQKSRFHAISADSLAQVRESTDWLEGYARIHGKYAQYSHCLVYQEVGTLMNTLRFARDVGDGICIQVSQGNDTDSFGATAGSLLGAFFGPDSLDARWLAPFSDRIHTALAEFHETSLSRLARRMGELPGRIATELA